MNIAKEAREVKRRCRPNKANERQVIFELLVEDTPCEYEKIK